MAVFTEDFSASSAYEAKLTVTLSSQNISANTSTLAWSLVVTKTSGSGYWTTSDKDWSVTINGTTYNTPSGWQYDFRDYSSKTIKTGSTVVTHTADGTKTISVSALAEMATAQGTSTPGGNITLPTIPRATQPSVTPTSVDAGTSVAINLPRASGSFTHTVRYSFGASSGTIPGGTGVGTLINWTPLVTLLQQIPNATSGTATIYADTYNGATFIGTKSTTLTIKAGSTVLPTVTGVNLSENVTTVQTMIGGYVQGQSKLNYTLTGTAGVQGSTIVTYKLAVAGQNLSGSTASGVTATLGQSGTVSVVASVTDSRGRTGTYTTSISVLAWTAPTIAAATVIRSNSGGTPLSTGNYLKVTTTASVSSLMVGTQKNSLTYQTFIRAKGAGSWGTAKNTVPLAGVVSIVDTSWVLGTYSETASWEVLLTISDKFTSSSQQFTITAGIVTMDWGDNTVGVGKFHERGTLDVGGDIATTSGILLGPLGQSQIASSHHTRGSSGAVYVRLATVNGVSSSSGSLIAGDFYGGSNYGTSARYSARIHFSERNGGGLLEVWEFGKPASASAQVGWRIKTISTYVYELWAVLPSFHETYSFVPTLVTQGTLDNTRTTTDPTGLSTTNVVVYPASPYQVPWGFARTDLAGWAIPTGATVVALGSADILDVMTFASDQFTIVEAGWYDIDGTMEVTPGSAGLGVSVILGYVQINGASSGTAVLRIWPQSNSGTVMSVGGKFLLSVGDTVRMAASRSAALTGATMGEATLSVRRIR